MNTRIYVRGGYFRNMWPLAEWTNRPELAFKTNSNESQHEKWQPPYGGPSALSIYHQEGKRPHCDCRKVSIHDISKTTSIITI